MTAKRAPEATTWLEWVVMGWVGPSPGEYPPGIPTRLYPTRHPPVTRTLYTAGNGVY